MLQQKHYKSDEHFRLEKKVLSNHWFFACLNKEIPNNRDYVTRQFFDTKIIVTNDKSQIRALSNVCPHRFNTIIKESKGNQQLICSFHGLAFNSNGTLRSRIKHPQKESICLKEYKTTIVGAFVFVNLSGDPYPITKQLGIENIEILEAISDDVSNHIDNSNIPHNVNWKLIIENILDKSHCPNVHKDSLVELGYCKNSESKSKVSSEVNFLEMLPVDDSKRRSRKKIIEKFIKKTKSGDSYQHYYIFPNLSIALYENLFLTVGSIQPISSEFSMYSLSHYFSNITSLHDKSEMIMNSLKMDVISFGEKVFHEDLEFLEVIQDNIISESSETGFHFEDEERIIQFYNQYLQKFNGKLQN